MNNDIGNTGDLLSFLNGDISLCCCVNTSSACNEQKQIKAEAPKLEPRLGINFSISSSRCFSFFLFLFIKVIFYSFVIKQQRHIYFVQNKKATYDTATDL